MLQQEEMTQKNRTLKCCMALAENYIAEKRQLIGIIDDILLYLIMVIN